jgi:opacity protein-like surface antigen
VVIATALASCTLYAAAYAGLAQSDENNLIFDDKGQVSLVGGCAPRRAGLGWSLDATYGEANVESYNWPGDDVEGDSRKLTLTANLHAYGPYIGAVRPYAFIGAGWMRVDYDIPGVVDLGATPFLMDARADGFAWRAGGGLTAPITGWTDLDIAAVYTSGLDRDVPLAAGPVPANPGIHRTYALRIGLRRSF